jgi:hypothetical protein
MTDLPVAESKKKRKSGVPTGNAGEYLVMGELLRRDFDAQLADRNTKGYDIVAGQHGADLKRIQVKTVRTQPWFVSRESFQGGNLKQITIYVLLGPAGNKKSARFFITKNSDVASHPHYPAGWDKSGFLKLSFVEQYENQWDVLRQ